MQKLTRIRGTGGGFARFDMHQGSAPPLASFDPRWVFTARSIPMMDVAMLAIGFVFFALSIGYVYACDLL